MINILFYILGDPSDKILKFIFNKDSYYDLTPIISLGSIS